MKPAKRQRPSSSSMKANSAPCVRGGLLGTTGTGASWEGILRMPHLGPQSTGATSKTKVRESTHQIQATRVKFSQEERPENCAPEGSSSLPRPPSHTSDPLGHSLLHFLLLPEPGGESDCQCGAIKPHAWTLGPAVLASLPPWSHTAPRWIQAH